MEEVKQVSAGNFRVQIRRENNPCISFSEERPLAASSHRIYVTRNDLATIAEFTDVRVNVRAQERNAQ